MPRYYFHLHDGEDHRDELGSDHRDFSDARANAVRQLAQRLLDSPERFDTDAYWRIQVVTGDGLMLTSLHLTEITAPAAQRPVPRRE